MAQETAQKSAGDARNRVVVVGAGFGGLEVCAQLDAQAEALGLDITLIDANPSFFVGLAGQLILQGHATRQECELSYESLSFQHVKFLQAKVTNVDTTERTLTATGQDAAINFDYLVLATGLKPKPSAIPELAANGHWICSSDEVLKLRDALASFRGGTILAVLPLLPEKCPPALYEYAFIIDEMLRASSQDPALREKTQIVIATQRPNAVPEAAPQCFNALCRDKGIRQEFSVQLKSIVAAADGARTAHFKGVAPARADEELAVPFDLLLNHMPYEGVSGYLLGGGSSGNSASSSSGPKVNPRKFIVADFATMRTSAENVWALGDCAHLMMPVGKPCPKAGGFAFVQGASVGKQILRAVRVAAAAPAAAAAAWGPEAADRADLLGDGDEVVCASEVGGGLGAPIHINLWNSQKKPRFVVDEPSAEGLRGMWRDWADQAARWFTLPDGYYGLHKCDA